MKASGIRHQVSGIRNYLKPYVLRLMSVWRSQAGFSLVEMMTVLMIIAVLTAIVVASTQVGNQRQQLRDAAANYVASARNADTLAATSRTFPDPNQDNEPTPRKAYGVCITSSETSGSKCKVDSGQRADSYQVYARDTAETGGSVKEALGDPPANPHIVATYTLPKDFVFAEPHYYLDYIPPAPTLFANGEQDNVTLVIRKFDANSCSGSKDCQTIEVRPRAGSVYVQ